MPFPVFTNSGGTSPANIGVVIYPGMAVIEISPGIFIPYTAAAALIYVGSAVGCALTTTVPGGPITVQCDGECPSALISIGAGNDSTVVITGVGGFARGTTGLVCGFCDPSGNLTIVPTRIGSQYGTLHNGRALFGTPVTGQAPVLDSTGKFIFQTVLQPGSVTGTGLWFSTAGTLDAAAATLTGDVSQLALSGNNLPLEVTGLLSNALPALSAGYLEWNGSAWSFAPFATAFTPANDLLGNSTSSATHQYVSSLSYSSVGYAHGAVSAIAVNGTGAALNWIDAGAQLQYSGTGVLLLGSAVTDYIKFGATPPTTGFIRATLGASGTTFANVHYGSDITFIGFDSSQNPYFNVGTGGNIGFQVNTTPVASITSTSFLFANTVATPTIKQSALTTDVATNQLDILGQNCALASTANTAGGSVLISGGNGPTSNATGGSVYLNAPQGSGSGANGVIALQSGGTTFLTLVNNAVQIAAGVASPVWNQAKPATDSPTNSWVIQAQSAELAAVTNVTGGSLYLYAGAGATSSGVSGNVYIISPSASGTNGSVILQAGGATSATVGYPTVRWGVVNHGGDSTQSSAFAFVVNGSISCAGTNPSLSASQAANPIIPLNGTLSATCTITLPNALGAVWYFDLTSIVFNSHQITFTTGSGTTAAVSALKASGYNLIMVSIVANHVVSIG